MRPSLPSRVFTIQFCWVGLLCGAFLVMLGDLLPFPLPFVEPGSFLTCVVEVQIFFVLFIWPLLLPGLLRGGADRPALLLAGGLLIVLALPLVLVAANVSNTEPETVFRGQALVAALALLGAGAQVAGSVYVFLMLALSIVPPFWAFLASEFSGRDFSAFARVSPFWAAGSSDGSAAPILSAGAVALGAVLLFLARLPSSKVDGPAAPQ